MHCRTSSRRIPSIHDVFLTSFTFVWPYRFSLHGCRAITSFFHRRRLRLGCFLPCGRYLFLLVSVITAAGARERKIKQMNVGPKDRCNADHGGSTVQCCPFSLQSTLLFRGARPCFFEHTGKSSAMLRKHECNAHKHGAQCSNTWSAKLM